MYLRNIPIYISNPNANDVTKFATGMQDGLRNCVKEKPPPPWPGATPESFANALKMWEKEVRGKIPIRSSACLIQWAMVRVCFGRIPSSGA